MASLVKDKNNSRSPLSSGQAEKAKGDFATLFLEEVGSRAKPSRFIRYFRGTSDISNVTKL